MIYSFQRGREGGRRNLFCCIVGVRSTEGSMNTYNQIFLGGLILSAPPWIRKGVSVTTALSMQIK